MKMSVVPLRAPFRIHAPQQSRFSAKRRSKLNVKLNKETFSDSHWKNNGACHVDDGVFRQAVDWIKSYGGYVSPSLTLGYSVTTGTRDDGYRGIIAKSDVLEEELRTGPLITVPNSLQITGDIAQFRLRPICKYFKCPPLELLSREMQTSLFLAYEKNKGKNSFWSTYIETLPSIPSSAWLLPENELRVEIAFLPHSVKGGEDWMTKAKIFIHAQYAEINDAVEDYGDHLGVDFDELKWALGQVHSRAYDKECALVPIIDLLNHNPNALPPLGSVQSDEEDVPLTYVGSFLYGQPRPLSVGDELFVNYTIPEETSSLELFLRFGFIPVRNPDNAISLEGL